MNTKLKILIINHLVLFQIIKFAYIFIRVPFYKRTVITVRRDEKVTAELPKHQEYVFKNNFKRVVNPKNN